MLNRKPAPLVRIVDDDPTVCESLKFILELAGFEVRSFGNAADFLTLDDHSRAGCLILDVRMPGMSGLELQHEMLGQSITLPIIFLTGHGDIEMAVETLHAGAVDFLVKPPEPEKLIERVKRAVERNRIEREEQAEADELRDLVSKLTDTELSVAQMISNGLQTKEIAQALGVSEQAIKMHRSNIYHKLDAVNPVEVSRIMTDFNRTR